MNDNVRNLKAWFDKLPRGEQEAVLEFLYGKILVKKGLYCGPAPEMIVITEGLFAGPAPASGGDQGQKK